jgi:mannosyltransferase
MAQMTDTDAGPAAPAASSHALPLRLELLLERRFTILLGCFAAVSAALGLVFLTRESLWEDELLTLGLVSRSFGDFLRALPDRGNEPLYDALFWVVAHLGGTSAAWLRLPSVLAVAASVPVTGLVGKRMMGRAGGALAALFLALSSYALLAATLARPYAFALLFAAVSTLLLQRAVERPSRGRIALYALSIVALAGTHDFAILVVLAHPILVATRSRRAGLVFGGACAAAVALFFAWPAGWAERAFIWTTPPTSYTVDYVTTAFKRGAPDALIAVALLVVAAFVVYLWRRRPHSRPTTPRDVAFLAVWLLGPFLCLFVYSAVRHPVFVTRYVEGSLPALCLLLAVVCVFLGQRLGAVAACAVAIAFLAGSINSGVRLTQPDVEGAVRFLDGRFQPGDLVAVPAGSAQEANGLLYFSPRFGGDRLRLVFTAGDASRVTPPVYVVDGDDQEAGLEQVARRTRRLWVFEDGFVDARAAAERAAFFGGCRDVERHDFRGGIRVSLVQGC